ncbi:MAG: WecB/TagA/CpsF family glycosyltransferase [Ignavibacteriae bacterium]|nr:WecB/TagA/CpsF family glycosyltransferase [Ignavibacteriota bacterium]
MNSRDVDPSPAAAHLCGVRLDLLEQAAILERVAAAIATRTRCVIAGPHFSILLQAQDDDALRVTLNSCDIVHPDGIGSVLGLRIGAGVAARRVNGTDLYVAMLRSFPPTDVRYYFLGGDDETQRRLRASLREKWSQLSSERIHGAAGLLRLDDAGPADAVNAASPDVLFVGLGSPLQFQWIERWRDVLHVPVIVAVGAGLEFLSGRRARAPRLMRALGLEWLHRLLLEPRRLWRRYLLGIPRFLVRILRERARRKNRRARYE